MNFDKNNNMYNDKTNEQKFDFDTPSDADFDNNIPSEFATDLTIPETSMPTPDDFIPSPSEYSVSQNDNDETAATRDDFNVPVGMYDSDYGDEETVLDDYDIEAAEDYDARDGYYKYATEDYDVEHTDPSDETAATNDDWYTTADGGKTPAQARCELDDYEIISDVLGSEKQIVKLYSTALCEASEEPFRNLLKGNLDDAAADQYKAFKFMEERGMYQTEQATEQKISQAKQQFSPLCENSCVCKGCNCDNDCDCDN